MSEKIRERLGLDFLRPRVGSDASPSSIEDPVLTSALMTYGLRILDFLEANNGTSTVYQLIDHIQMPIDVALKVIDYFASRRAVEVVRRDLKGDHTLVITPVGRSMLGQQAAT